MTLMNDVAESYGRTVAKGLSMRLPQRPIKKMQLSDLLLFADHSFSNCLQTFLYLHYLQRRET